ncbi:MAG: dihydrofolate reductase family protein [Thermoplasmata archaeon]|jgi:dihydrofolate reductase
MRKLTAHMYTTLDGRAEFPEYPSEAPTGKPDPAFQEMWIDRYDSVDTLLFGKTAYETHFAYWTPSKRTAKDPPFIHDFSRWKEAVPKVVISNSLKKAEWNNTRVMKGDLAGIVAKLKKEPGKDMILEGGPNITQQFVEKGLIDDYRIVVMPVILGKGLNWFGALPKQETLKLVSCKSLVDGELVLHYEARR